MIHERNNPVTTIYSSIIQKINNLLDNVKIRTLEEFYN